ncbi:MAG: hypothetical protein J1F10_01580 [Muribaculaceae bacterium]|nr:hypothetical protein [Muribaculaceae bacterium]
MNQILKLSAMLATVLSFTGCSSTTVEEIAKQGEVSNTVTITAKAPVVSTREANGALRYKAFLFKDNKTENKCGSFVDAQEQLDNTGANFSFTVDEAGDYVILFVADYLTTATLNSGKVVWVDGKQEPVTNGYTDNNNESLYKVNFNPANKRFLVMNIDNGSPYNTDNYEVFAGKVPFTKGNDKLDLQTITLKRPVCKVTIQEKEESITNLKATITKAKIGYEYDLYNQKVVAPDYDDELDAEENSFIQKDILPANPNNNELFYFYAFANAGDAETTIADGGLAFTLTGGQVDFKHTIPADKLKFKPNYKYILKGNFVRKDMGQVNIKVIAGSDWDSDGTDVDI